MRVVVTGGAASSGNLVLRAVEAGHDVTVSTDLSHGSASTLPDACAFITRHPRTPGWPDVVRAARPGRRHPSRGADRCADLDRRSREDRAVNTEGTRAAVSRRAARDAGPRGCCPHPPPRCTAIGRGAHSGVRREGAGEPLRELEARMPKARASPRPWSHGDGLRLPPLLERVRAGGRTGRARGVVAIFGHALAAGALPVIYGDGAQTRDFVFVGDIVSALLAAAAHPSPLARSGPDGPAYNVSTGVETSVLDLAALMRGNRR